ncbi:hypothetical protein ENUP19_0019G0023 [Entamoeba nuttalli]|uniref:Uncharacterized protein n=1 Tax=Entamoeba nuttalli TaxID=412467 RepID=A0ABQ0D8T3_9EUKA
MYVCILCTLCMYLCILCMYLCTLCMYLCTLCMYFMYFMYLYPIIIFLLFLIPLSYYYLLIPTQLMLNECFRGSVGRANGC